MMGTTKSQLCQIKITLPGPPLATCSKTSKSRVTGFPGKAFAMVDTVEKTVDSTVVDNVDRNLFNLLRYSMFAVKLTH